MPDSPYLTESIVRELYEIGGLSAQEIAGLLGTGAPAVRRVMRHAGIKARSRSEAMRLQRARQIDRLVVIPEDQLRHLYLENELKPREIAERYGCSSQTVRKRLRQIGIPLSLPGRMRVVVTQQELENLYYKQGMSLREASNRLGCDHSTVRKKLAEFGLGARSYSEANLIYPRQDFSNNESEKAYLVGFRLGDLYVSTFGSGESTIVVNCGTTKQEQIDLISNLFRLYGHIQIGRPNQKGCRNINCYLNSTFDFLVPKIDAVPAWVQSNEDNSLAFAAGYIDAEGSFFIAGAAGRFAVSSYDKNIIHWLYDWFIGIGADCRPPNVAGHAGALRPNGSIYKKDVWTLNVNRKKSLAKLTALLEPRLMHAKRLSDLRRVKANVDARMRK